MSPGAGEVAQRTLDARFPAEQGARKFSGCRMNKTAKWMRILESLCTAAALGCSGEAKAPSGFENSGAQLRSGSSQKPTTTPQTSDTTNRLQAVSPVDENVVWASGVGGTYTVTTDGGNHWAAHVVPGA